MEGVGEYVQHEEEALKENLVGKANIYILRFVRDPNRLRSNKEDNVLEGLQPHPNLEILEMDNFMVATFPSSMIMSLSLPTLSNLLNLRHLEINRWITSKRVAAKFYGYDVVVTSKQTRALFVLKIFKLVNGPQNPISPEDLKITS
ncbi:hypothetical protein CerSpe_077930 [Prunus speciosa]